MIDINELRRLALDGDLAAMQEIILRLEAAEKELAELRSSMKFRTSLIGRTEAERDALRAELAQLHKEADKFGDGVDWIQRALQAEAQIEAMEQQKPVEWQTRTRPAWNDGTWGPWRKCSEEYAEDIEKTPLLHDWLYEARALYALPGAKALLRVPDAVMAALDSLDDYIARIEGNDRGTCDHINLLRRYLLDATEVGENE